MIDAQIHSTARPKLAVQPLDVGTNFRTQAYEALKEAITAIDIYDHPEEIRLDERQICQDLSVSRTPIREAMTILEQEGFVRSLPRRGVFVVRKTRKEILEMIQVSAALESMAARLGALHATEQEIADLRTMFVEFEREAPSEHINEYSDANIAFHQALIRLGGNQLIVDRTDHLFIHMRAIRRKTISQDNRAERSIKDHMRIIEALEQRDPDLAERLVREHALGLAEHVERHCDFLD